MTVSYSLTIRKLNQQSRCTGSSNLRRARGFNIQRRQLNRSSSKESSTSSAISNSSFKMSSGPEIADRTEFLHCLGQSHTCNQDMCRWATQISPAILQHEEADCCHDNLVESRKQLAGHKLSSNNCEACIPLFRSMASSSHECNHETIPENEELTDVNQTTPLPKTSRSSNELRRGSSDAGRLRPRFTKYLQNRAYISEIIAKWKSNRSLYSQIDRERKATQVMTDPLHYYHLLPLTEQPAGRLHR